MRQGRASRWRSRQSTVGIGRVETVNWLLDSASGGRLGRLQPVRTKSPRSDYHTAVEPLPTHHRHQDGPGSQGRRRPTNATDPARPRAFAPNHSAPWKAALAARALYSVVRFRPARQPGQLAGLALARAQALSRTPLRSLPMLSRRFCASCPSRSTQTMHYKLSNCTRRVTNTLAGAVRRALTTSGRRCDHRDKRQSVRRLRHALTERRCSKSREHSAQTCVCRVGLPASRLFPLTAFPVASNQWLQLAFTLRCSNSRYGGASTVESEIFPHHASPLGRSSSEQTLLNGIKIYCRGDLSKKFNFRE